MAALLLPARALGFACVLGVAAELLLGALWLLADDEEGETAATAVTETAGTSATATAASLEPVAATSAATVETVTGEIAWTSTGASTTGDWVAVTSGADVELLCESVVD